MSSTGATEDRLAGWIEKIRQVIAGAAPASLLDREFLEGRLAVFTAAVQTGSALEKSAHCLRMGDVVMDLVDPSRAELGPMREEIVGLLRDRGLQLVEVEVGERVFAAEWLRQQPLDRLLSNGKLNLTATRVKTSAGVQRVALRFVPLDRRLEGSDEGQVATAYPGVIGEQGPLLRPYVQVWVLPFADFLCERVAAIVSATSAPSATSPGPRIELSQPVLQACRHDLDGLSAEQRNTESALGPVRVLAALLLARSSRDGSALLDQVQAFHAYIGRQGGVQGKDKRLLEDLGHLDAAARRLGGRLEQAEICARIKAAEQACHDHDYRRLTALLGECARRAWELRQDTDGGIASGASLIVETAGATIREPLGGVMIVASNFREIGANRAHRARFEETLAQDPVDGAPQGSLLDLLAPGVLYNHEVVVPPSVLVSRASLGRIHSLIRTLADSPAAATDRRLSTELHELWLGVQNTDGEKLEDKAGLERLHRIVGRYYPKLSDDLRATYAARLKEVYDAEVTSWPAGELMSDADRGTEAGGDRRHAFQVAEWRPAHDLRGTVLSTATAGLACPRHGLFLPAQVVLSRGPRVAEPWLERLQEVVQRVGADLAEKIRRLLYVAKDHLGNHLVTEQNRRSVVQHALILHQALTHGATTEITAPEITAAEVEEFLAGHDCRPFPAADQLLTVDDLRPRTGRYEVEYRFDKSLGRGRLCSTERPGWLLGDDVVRPARVTVSLGVEPEICAIQQHVHEIVTDRLDHSSAILRAMDEVYLDRIQPTIASRDLLAELTDGSVDPRLIGHGVELLRQLEVVADELRDEELDGVVERLAALLRRWGLEVMPEPGKLVPGTIPTSGLALRFDESLPAGTVGRVARRVVWGTFESGPHESGAQQAEEVLAVAEVSVGPPPPVIRAVEALEKLAGESLAAVRRLVHEVLEGSLGCGLPKNFYQDRATAILAVVEELESRIGTRTAVPGEDAQWCQTLETLLRTLASEGVEILPLPTTAPLREPRFTELYADVPHRVRWGSGPRGSVAEVHRRALVVDREIRRQGELSLCSGEEGRLADQLESVLGDLPALPPALSDHLGALRAIETERLISEVEGRTSDHDHRRVAPALEVFKLVQDQCAGTSPAADEALRSLRSILQDQCGVRFLPHGTTAAAVAAECTADDTVDEVWGDEQSGTIEVERYGWTNGSQRQAFVVRICRGKIPAYLAALDQLFGERLAVDDPELQRMFARLHTPGGLGDSPEHGCCQLYQALCDQAARSSGISSITYQTEARRLLGFMTGQFGMTAFPSPGEKFQMEEHADYLSSGIEVRYDPTAENLTIPEAGVRRAGIRTKDGTVLVEPQFVVLHASSNPVLEVLVAHLARVEAGSEPAQVWRDLATSTKKLQLLPAECDQTREVILNILAAWREDPGVSPSGESAWIDITALWRDLTEQARLDLPSLDELDEMPLRSGLKDSLQRLRRLEADETLGPPWIREEFRAAEFSAELARIAGAFDDLALHGYLTEQPADHTAARRASMPPEQIEKLHRDRLHLAIEAVNVFFLARERLFMHELSTSSALELSWVSLNDPIKWIDYELGRSFKTIQVDLNWRNVVEEYDSSLVLDPIETQPRATPYPTDLLRRSELLVVRPCYRCTDDGKIKQRGKVRKLT